MKPITIAAQAAVFVLLGACASAPSLKAQLSGKPPMKRQEILTHTCHVEAEQGIGTRKSGLFRSHVERMHEICDRMAQEFHAS